jgi:hypothetical protein
MAFSISAYPKKDRRDPGWNRNVPELFPVVAQPDNIAINQVTDFIHSLLLQAPSTNLSFNF